MNIWDGNMEEFNIKIKNRFGVDETHQLVFMDDYGLYTNLYYLCSSNLRIDDEFAILRSSLIKPDLGELAQAVTDVTKVLVDIKNENLKYLHDNIHDYVKNKSKYSLKSVSINEYNLVLMVEKIRFSMSTHSDITYYVAKQFCEKVRLASLTENQFIYATHIFEAVNMISKTNIAKLFQPKFDVNDVNLFLHNFYPSLEKDKVQYLAWNLGCHNHTNIDEARYIAIDEYPHNIFMGR